jgi:hypothetical protein
MHEATAGDIVMAGGQALSPGEVMVLLDPNGAKAREALKVTVLALVAQGVLRFEERVGKGLLGREKRSSVLNLAPAAPTPPGPAAAVVETLAPIAPEGEAMPQVVARLQRRFGPDLGRFVTEAVRPVLVSRGLLEPRREKLLWLIPVTRFRPTPAGESEQGRLRELMLQARDIPAFLDRDPVQAVALVAALGAAILLVPELRPHLAQLSSLMKDQSALDGFSDFGSGGSGSDHAFGSGLDAFDLSAFDVLDQDLSAFDASFDSVGDGGGSDGGGDGGGGGD